MSWDVMTKPKTKNPKITLKGIHKDLLDWLNKHGWNYDPKEIGSPMDTSRRLEELLDHWR